MAGGLLGLALGYVMMTVLEGVLRNQPLNPSFVPYWIPAEATIGINGPVLLFTFVVSVLSGVGRDQAIGNMRTVDQLEADARAPDRLRTWFLGIFAGVALLLSAIGIYGVFAHAVVQRTHEVGIRAALGARPRHLVWLILSQGMVLSAVGLLVGFLGALGVTRLLRTFLFGVSVVDPIAISTTAVTLAAVAALACYIPARRATTIDPMTALRTE